MSRDRSEASRVLLALVVTLASSGHGGLLNGSCRHASSSCTRYSFLLLKKYVQLMFYKKTLDILQPKYHII